MCLTYAVPIKSNLYSPLTYINTVNTASMPLFMTFPALISFLLILSHGFITGAQTQNDNNGTDLFGTACAGWEIPTNNTPLKIGVPCYTVFSEFVKVNLSETSEDKKYEGFCIDIFREVHKLFRIEKNYTLPYEFVPYHDWTYDDLVKGVANGTFHGAIGDITILADRMKLVDFTQPYVDSRLVMIAPAKSLTKALMFLKPFTKEMWIVTGAILTYTVFIVWLLEHRTNPEFEGSWKNQIGTALWFTFSSLFFSHRERVHSNFTRVVVVVWLFVVLILSTNYTANLSAMLTVSQLKPKVTSIEELKKTNSTIGCDGDSFVVQFLKDEFGFNAASIKAIRNGNDYVKEFESGNIFAAFLELPYGKDFMSRYGKEYTMTEPKYIRFGGFGFVFQKCSPIATNVSEAILTLLKNGELKTLENKWFGNSFEYSDLEAANKSDSESLSIKSFWVIYLITFATSTILGLIHSLQNYRHSIANFAEILSFQNFRGLFGYLITSATSTVLSLIHLQRNYRHRPEEYARPSNIPSRHLQASPSPEVEIT